MAYIIEDTDNLDYHTDLKTLLKPLRPFVPKYKWLLTNQEYIVLDYKKKGNIYKLNFTDAKIEFSGEEFMSIFLERDIQFIWGVFSAFKNEIPNLSTSNLPFADGNSDIWEKPDEFLTTESEIEIICFDSSATIVKFKDKEIERLFLDHFPEAELLIK